MDTVTLSSKGQLVIPKAVRDDAKVSAGSQFAVRYEGGEIHLRPLPATKATTVADVAGCLARLNQERLSDGQVSATIKARLKARNAP
jgi:AbrB family looped-hinge helix DNA binding protein